MLNGWNAMYNYLSFFYYLFIIFLKPAAAARNTVESSHTFPYPKVLLMSDSRSHFLQSPSAPAVHMVVGLNHSTATAPPR